MRQNNKHNLMVLEITKGWRKIAYDILKPYAKNRDNLKEERLKGMILKVDWILPFAMSFLCEDADDVAFLMERYYPKEYEKYMQVREGKVEPPRDTDEIL